MTQLGIANLATWQQDAMFNPANPNQIARVQYAAIPGRYASWYYNQIPTTAKLQGVFDSLPDWTTALFVVALGAGVGFFGSRFIRKGKKK